MTLCVPRRKTTTSLLIPSEFVTAIPGPPGGGCSFRDSRSDPVPGPGVAPLFGGWLRPGQENPRRPSAKNPGPGSFPGEKKNPAGRRVGNAGRSLAARRPNPAPPPGSLGVLGKEPRRITPVGSKNTRPGNARRSTTMRRPSSTIGENPLPADGGGAPPRPGLTACPVPAARPLVPFCLSPLARICRSTSLLILAARADAWNAAVGSAGFGFFGRITPCPITTSFPHPPSTNWSLTFGG